MLHPQCRHSNNKTHNLVQHQCHGVSQSLATDVHALVLHVVQPLMKQGPFGKFCTHRGTLGLWRTGRCWPTAGTSMKWTLFRKRMRFMLTGSLSTWLEVAFGLVLAMHANFWHLSIRHGAALESLPFLSFFGAGELVLFGWQLQPCPRACSSTCHHGCTYPGHSKRMGSWPFLLLRASSPYPLCFLLRVI